MGILSRLNTLIKSNLNSAVDRMSSPEREIDILISDMEDAVKKARQEVQACLVSEKLAIKERDRLRAESASWEQKATRAVQMGEDDLAREALAQKATVDTLLANAEKTVRDQEAYVDELTASLKSLEQRVAEVKLRKGTLKQQARSRAGAGKGGSAFAEFERLSGKVDAMDAEVDIDAELAGQTSREAETDRKLRELDRQSTIDDALEALKKKLQ
ncbi:MAG TPA: PspA/IM30 family protein [Polyangia bacterium]|jgi:phage shock protein A